MQLPLPSDRLKIDQPRCLRNARYVDTSLGHRGEEGVVPQVVQQRQSALLKRRPPLRSHRFIELDYYVA